MIVSVRMDPLLGRKEPYALYQQLMRDMAEAPGACIFVFDMYHRYVLNNGSAA